MMADVNTSGDFITVKSLRAPRTGPRNEEDEKAKQEHQAREQASSGGRSGDCGWTNRKMQSRTNSQGTGKRTTTTTEWDYRWFSVIVAKTDESSVGLEKMISERRLVASYNWDPDSWIPTIVVPGAPKIFNPWSGGLLETKNEAMTIDEEAFRIPNAPMEPLFTALRLCQPSFKLSDVDLVADLNCLKKLLRFVLLAAFPTDLAEDEAELVAGTVNVKRNLFAGSGRNCDFRIDGQVLGETVVLMRREMEHRGRAMGFGMAYLDACTKLYDADLKASGPHKRVTYVNFGGLRMLLRHKTLAAMYSNSLECGNKQAPNKRMAPSVAGGDLGQSPSSMGYSAVRYVRGGYLGDHNELAQIEFASVSKERKHYLVIDKWLDMLFIGSDHLYLGQHVRGRFEQPTMRTRAEALQLSGLKSSDARRILVILQMLLEKIVRYGRRSSDAFPNGGRPNDNQRGDTATTREPFSFAIISSDECRKLTVYKANTTMGCRGRQANKHSYNPTPPPPSVSESMLASLLADDQANWNG